MEQMIFDFLGTGAADHNWQKIGEPGVRGSAGTLVNGEILIDCGTTGLQNLSRFGILPAQISNLLITHSHGDHFSPDVISRLIELRNGSKPLDIWASPQAVSRLEKILPGDAFIPHSLLPEMHFQCAGLEITTLPGNHQTDDRTEKTLHYLLENRTQRALYALDGAWMLKEARQQIGARRLDLIVWDATVSTPGDFRIFEHNDLYMIDHMTKTLTNEHIIDEKTKVVYNHIARTMWPESLNECEILAKKRGAILAFDGMKLTL